MDFIIEKLDCAHEASGFDCGIESMTTWIKRYALSSKQSDITQPYVLHRQEETQIIGYYALSAGDVNREAAPERIAKGMPNYPIGVVVLTRLASIPDFRAEDWRQRCSKMHLSAWDEPPRS